MRDREARKRLLKSFCAAFLAFVMLFTNVMGAVEVNAAGELPTPTINDVFYGTTTISGGNLHREKVDKKTLRATVYVKLTDKDGGIKANVSVTPTRGKTWTVSLPEGVKVAEGDKVTVYQQLGDDKSPEVTADAKPSLSFKYKDTLKMPQGDIWIEDTSSNLVNDDEKAEAVQMLKDVNPSIATNFKEIKFSINGTSNAYFEVIYTDGSKTEKIEAKQLHVKQVTETSRGININNIVVTDKEIKGKLDGERPFTDIKLEVILKVGEGDRTHFCSEGKCTTTKNSSKPISLTVNDDGSFIYTLQGSERLDLNQVVGVAVKEPHKFKSCKTTTVKLASPEKTDVRDPRNPTKEDKEAIDKAIRIANTVDGVSKLPNGTGDWDGVPAVIQIDDSGNAKIFSGNDVAGDWDPNNDYKFVPETNEEGSYKLKEGAEPKITIPAKDLVKNLAPDAPEIKVNESDKTKITINAQAVDTDANVITISYTDSDDTSKTIEATKADDGNWSITEGEGTVDANGVVSLEISKVKGATNVTATVTDKGGIADDDKDVLTSDPAEFKVTKAILVEALGGIEPVVMKKWVGDELNWKDGVKAKDDTKKEDVDKLLNGATFEDVTEEKRSTSKEGDFTGKIKVTFDDGSFIEVADQMLYVSNLVTPANKENLPDDALNVQFKLGEGVKVEDKDPNSGEVTKTTKGNKDNPVLYKEYKVKPGTDLSTYKHPTLQKNIFELIDEKADEGYTDLVWKGQDANDANNFVAAAGNNVFTAAATKTYDVTFDPNGGSGTMDSVTKKANEKYTLPENGFKAPKDKVFDGWMVGTEKKSVGDTITVNIDTEVKAVWKDKASTPGEGGTTPDPSKPNQPTPNAPSNNGGNYLILEKVEPKDPSGQWETGRHYKYLYGYPDGSVRPEGQITRAEAAGLIARLAELDLSNKEKPNFKDTPSRWYNSAINVMVAKDLMFGDKNGNFRPNEPITRGEFARALYYIDTKNDKVAPFEDVKGHEFEAAINQAYGNGRIAGYPDGSFKPDAYIQRAEAARMLNQYADRGVTLEGMAGVKKDVIRFTDINESHWAYCEVMEAANTHDYRRAKGRLNETWLRIIQDDNRVAR